MANIISLKKNLMAKKKDDEVVFPKMHPLNVAIKICLYLLVFLLPLFFLPITSDPFEFSKVFLFGILTLLASFLYLLKIIIKKETQITRTFLNWPILTWLVLYLLATLFSVSKYNSLVGISGYFSDSLPATFFFVLLFYLIINNIKGIKEALRLFFVLFISSIILVIYNFLQIKEIYILPFDLTQNTSFNLLANSSYALSIFLSLTCLFLFGLILFTKSKLSRIIAIIFFVFNFLFLIFIDLDIGWYVLMIGLFVFLILTTLRSREIKSSIIISPSIFLAVVVLLLFLNTSTLLKIDLPGDTLLNLKTSWQINKEIVSSRPILGTGPQTFNYNFEKYRTVDFNNSNLWNLRFIKSGNTLFQTVSNVGLVGLLVFLVISFWYLFNRVFSIVKAKQVDEAWLLSSVLLSGWLALLIISFFYPLSFILIFLWWLFLALGIVSVPMKRVNTSSYYFGKNSLFTLMTSILFILVIIGSALFIYFAGRIWLADINYVKALKARDRTEDLSIVKSYLEKAIKLNSQATDYHFVLAQALATEAQIEATKAEPNIEVIQTLSQKSIDESKVGMEKDQKNPIVYENQASILTSLRNLLNNADERAAEAYEKAVSLEPNNPILYLNLGRSRLMFAQNILRGINVSEEDRDKANNNLDLAIFHFEKAASLKQAMADAYYNKALALELKGDKEEAFQVMEGLLSTYPSNPDVIYALGEMYMRNNRLDEAVDALNKTISLNPNHVNAHWQLGLIYEQNKEIDKAISEFETVQKLNPDNELVKQKLDELKK